MTDRISIGQLYPNAVPPGAVKRNGSARTASATISNKSFQELFQAQMLRFSHHAELRLKQRGIQLQPEQLSKIESAIDKAAAKGAKDSLILYQDMAFIVNIKNRTVVTAMDGDSLQNNVFTQIDSTVVVN